MPVQRFQVGWEGFIGAPGVSTFWVLDGSAATPHIVNFYNGLGAFVPPDVTWTFPTDGDEIDVASGHVTGVWTGPGNGPLHPDGGPVYSAPVGGLVRWLTASFAGGRRLAGRTFIVPMSSTSFGNDGLLTFLACWRLWRWAR